MGSDIQIESSFNSDIQIESSFNSHIQIESIESAFNSHIEIESHLGENPLRRNALNTLSPPTCRAGREGNQNPDLRRILTDYVR